MGRLREEITSECPEDFLIELNDHIDKIEALIVEVDELLDINTLDDLDNISKAKSITDQLRTDLY